MIVVSDTSPLNYMILIDELAISPGIFERIYVPSIVLHELSDMRAPDPVRKWAMAPPKWVTVLDPTIHLKSTFQLDQGEAASISLAKQHGISTLLIDERRGTKVAIAEGLSPLPTLALLSKAAEMKLLDFPATVAKLRQTSIRLSESVIDAALKEHAARKNKK